MASKSLSKKMYYQAFKEASSGAFATVLPHGKDILINARHSQMYFYRGTLFLTCKIAFSRRTEC